MSRIALAGIALATLLAAWLRLHGLDIQVVQDDEWHAIHKLMSSSYGEIARSFGLADHSIPLTLFYKAMAETIGLDEVDMRIVQAACGIALVALCGWLAWRATVDTAITILFAVLVAGSPFLVLYSRFARPYAITTLLSVLVLAGLWRWRSARSDALAAAICAAASLAAWLHPLAALYPMAALFFILVEDLRGRHFSPSARSTILLAVAAGLAIAAPLMPPLLNDLQSLSAKAGDSHPSLYTLTRVASLFAGGLPDLATAAVCAIAAWGAVIRLRDREGPDRYVLFAILAPFFAVIVLGGSWTHQGHTLARYVFPAQLAFLFWASAGIVDVGARVVPWRPRRARGAVAALAALSFLASTPTIRQVLTLGPWYGHLYYHFDYVAEDNRAARFLDGWPVPDFYRKLAAMPAGSVTIIEAPFQFVAPYNPDARLARIHRQHELQGFVHDLCLGGPYYGEVPRDARFRFRSFVDLGDRDSVAKSGARYILLQRDQRNGEPFKQAEQCLDALERRYGEPIAREPRLAVFDVRPR
jgi:hypothetical protein